VATRTAACNCGQLCITCEGEPVRVSMCHCLECQRRTGAVFGKPSLLRAQPNDVNPGQLHHIHAAVGLRPLDDIPVLPDLRLDGLLGDRRIPGLDRRRCGIVRRFRLSGTQAFCLGETETPLG
jgi:hypothetical protein